MRQRPLHGVAPGRRSASRCTGLTDLLRGTRARTPRWPERQKRHRMRRWLIWNVLFRLHEQAKGHATFRILRDMESADRLSFAELEQLQAEKLQDLLRYSY